MDMFNKSLCSDEVSNTLKKTIVLPILKKPNLDVDDLANYRQVFNLPFISMLLEKVVAKRLSVYLDDNKLLPHHQSEYRRFNGTFTCSVGPDISIGVGKVSACDTFGYERCIRYWDLEILLRHLDATPHSERRNHVDCISRTVQKNPCQRLHFTICTA